MKDDTAAGCAGIVVAVTAGIIGIAIGNSFCYDSTVVPMQAKAVSVGAAEWVVNPETGKTTFTWKEPKS